MTKFLRFVVSEVLRERADGLKESILGEAVFDRGEAFDPRIDPIVRVQAAKLRTRLQEYYSEQGTADPVEIELPKGTYVPIFRKRTTAAPALPESGFPVAGPVVQATEKPAAGAGFGRRGNLLVAAISTLAVVGVLFLYSRTTSDKQAPLRFTQLTYHRGATSFPALSRDGKLLVYSSDRESTHFSIWGQRVGDGTPVRITHHDADDLTPDISPDSRLIVFRSRQDGGGIYLISVDGREERRIADHAWMPRFSPDGAWISCLAARPGTDGVLLAIPAAGGRPYEVATGNVAPVGSPVWSADGQSLLFLGSVNNPGRGPRSYDWYLVPRIGGEAVSVGFRQALTSAGLGPPERELAPGDWNLDTVVFSFPRDSSAGIWKVTLKQGSRTIQGPALPMTSGSAIEACPRLSARGELLFQREDLESWVFAVPLDPATGLPAGDPARITEDAFPASHGLFPALSSSGQQVTFAHSNLGEYELVTRDLSTGRDTVLARLGKSLDRPLISKDGKRALLRGNPPKPETIYAASAGSVPVPRECKTCGRLEDWSADGRWLLYNNASMTSLMLMDWNSGATVEWIRYAPQRLTRAVFSRDGRRVAVAIDGSGGFLIPFDPHRVPSRNEWVQASDDADAQYLDWSPDGGSIYYFSRRDGYQCLWRREVKPESARAGDALAILHFHHNDHAPWSGWLSVANGKAAFVITEPRANVWMATTSSGKPF
ncbi:TolB-like translocation protein [Paludibaculum fermentans]|uniref:PD40 domain-containing protein n=1 Tax=Paludibaculum fermentans TaxID=1473598 RepID=A0A7S7NXC7_PALFE|nr:PD40 domain-containing protein [Paludibaculum fermentans]QOY91528.1 PD40 domain-containing protein [Paludibaculum fermentans]